MDIRIHPGKLSGHVRAIPSKSQAHRLLICAAFADAPTKLICTHTSQDIEATANCLRALGAGITRTETEYLITPIGVPPKQADLPCRESGSTLRFLLPIVGALGIDATFYMEGRLAKRPLSLLWEEMERMGCCLSRPKENAIRCSGMLHAGAYRIAGNISSQYLSGLLFAASLLEGDSQICITGKLESAPYVAMTQNAMALFGIQTEQFRIKGKQSYHSPGTLVVEGDWSNAAFMMAANFLGNKLTISDLAMDSIQGDRVVAELLPSLERHCIISASDIPDLIPILSVVAAANQGAVFTNIQRLRLKESDRVASTISMLHGLGGRAEATEDSLTVYGTGLTGGVVDSANDHRIAMSAAIASTVCHQPVIVLHAECVSKSYPQFWDEFTRLGGSYEQHLR